jgi:two-component system, OmpR family, osmolarity sensor histidine kinase EnvZ
VRISLFWRTFALIALVVVASVLAWFQLFRAAERQPRAERFAWEVASVVNLTRAGLLSASPDRRPELLTDLARDEGVRVLPLEATDRVEPWPDPRIGSLIEIKLRELLGPPSRIAGSVNGLRGLWISFDIEGDPYWLLLDAGRLDRQANRDWMLWLGIALLLALLGALAISRVVNRPLAQLAGAIDRLSRGEPAPRLQEDAPTEIAEVNRRFNLMAADLAALEIDRAEALAGISHDIRTPLTRLRLEIELSRLSQADRDSMGEEIERIDAIVRQFVEFARPAGAGPPQRVDVSATIDAVLDGFRNGHGADRLEVGVEVPAGLEWIGDPTVLERIVSNLVENARRYGRTPGSDRSEITVRAQRLGRMLQIAVRDLGPGVPRDQLERLTRPFTRLDVERNRHGGAGLGLAVVARLARRYGGDLALALPADGGLQATVRLRDDALPTIAPQPVH